MSSPRFNFDRLKKKLSKNDTPALVLDITEHVVANILQYHIQIVKQKYRGMAFSKGRTSFNASNGFTFTSAGCPQGASHNNGSSENNCHMYVRGSDMQSDNEVVITRSLGYVEKLKEAVKEYNEDIS